MPTIFALCHWHYLACWHVINMPLILCATQCITLAASSVSKQHSLVLQAGVGPPVSLLRYNRGPHRQQMMSFHTQVWALVVPQQDAEGRTPASKTKLVMLEISWGAMFLDIDPPYTTPLNKIKWRSLFFSFLHG